MRLAEGASLWDSRNYSLKLNVTYYLYRHTACDQSGKYNTNKCKTELDQNEKLIILQSTDPYFLLTKEVRRTYWSVAMLTGIYNMFASIAMFVMIQIFVPKTWPKFSQVLVFLGFYHDQSHHVLDGINYLQRVLSSSCRKMIRGRKAFFKWKCLYQ